MTDNARQFDNMKFRSFCDDLKIKKHFSTPHHPQSNGQVEAVNKIIKHLLKTKIEGLKGAWADELPGVLWSYRTTTRTATGETPFSLAFGSEAMIPVEVGLPTWRVQNFDQKTNEDMQKAELDLLEEKRLDADQRNAVYKQRSAKYYDAQVRSRRFSVNDLVLKKIFPNPHEPASGPFRVNWEGPYIISRVLPNGAYELSTLEGEIIQRPWNAQHLKKFYV